MRVLERVKPIPVLIAARKPRSMGKYPRRSGVLSMATWGIRHNASPPPTQGLRPGLNMPYFPFADSMTPCVLQLMRSVRAAIAAASLCLVLALSAGCGSQPDPSAAAQATEELDQLRSENQELQRLLAENKELPRLRRENEEQARLREQADALPQLRQENEQLRAQLQSARAPKTPAPRR